MEHEQVQEVSKKSKRNAKKPIIDSIKNYALLHPFFIILGFAVVVYIQTLFFEYVYYDDQHFLFDSPQKIEKLTSLKAALTKPYLFSAYYRPVVNLSLYLDAQVAGDSPYMHHFTNMLIHCITSCLVFVLFRRLKYRDITALAAALLFAVHPLLTNSVSWIVGRNDMLAGMFGIGAFLFFLDYMEKGKMKSLLLQGLMLLLAVFSKEFTLILPLVFYAWWKLNKYEKPASSGLLYLVWVLPVALWLIMKTALKIRITDPYFSAGNLLINLRSIPESIARMVYPLDMPVLPQYTLAITLAGIIITAAAIYYIYKNKQNLDLRIIGFGAAWYLLLLLPGMFVRLAKADQTFDYLDCRMYMPFAGLLMIALAMIPIQVRELRKNSNLILLLAVLVFFGVTSIVQNQNYKDRVAYRKNAALYNSNMITELKLFSQKEIAQLQRDGNEKAKQGDYDGAIKAYDKLITIDTNNYRHYVNRGLVKIRANDLKGAHGDFNRVLQLKPNFIPALYQRGTLSMQLFDYKGAMADYDKALSIKPDYPPVLFQRGNLKIEMKNYKGAIEDLNQVLKIDPENLIAYSQRGIAEYELGNYESALKDCNEIIKVKQDFPNVWLQRGMIYRKMKKTKQACDDFRKSAGMGSKEAEKALKEYCK